MNQTAHNARELLYVRYGHIDIINEILRNIDTTIPNKDVTFGDRKDQEYEALSDEALEGKRFMVVEEHYPNPGERVPDAVTLHEDFASVWDMYTGNETLAIYDLDSWQLLAAGPEAVVYAQYALNMYGFGGLNAKT